MDKQFVFKIIADLDYNYSNLNVNTSIKEHFKRPANISFIFPILFYFMFTQHLCERLGVDFCLL